MRPGSLRVGGVGQFVCQFVSQFVTPSPRGAPMTPPRVVSLAQSSPPRGRLRPVGRSTCTWCPNPSIPPRNCDSLDREMCPLRTSFPPIGVAHATRQFRQARHALGLEDPLRQHVGRHVLLRIPCAREDIPPQPLSSDAEWSGPNGITPLHTSSGTSAPSCRIPPAT